VISKYMRNVRGTLVLMGVANIPEFSAALKTAIRRLKQLAREQHFKSPLPACVVSVMLADTSVSIVTRAAIATMWVAGLRISECASPRRDLESMDDAFVTRVGDVCVAADGAGYALRLRRSKGDPTNTGHTVHAHALRDSTGAYVGGTSCPVTLMRALLAARPPDPAAPLFAFLDNRLVTRRHIADVIKATVLRLGGDPRDFSTHSIRIGSATALAESGASMATILSWGRWTSEQCAMRYIRMTLERQQAIAIALALPRPPQ
jgi:integrase